ncbi:MAG: DNA methyltransferase [Planctomycetota bacterium]|nr:DNA methyltransferase [Planctomycetota bacterium]
MTSRGRSAVSMRAHAARECLTTPDGRTRVYVGDCRERLPDVPEVSRGEVDLVFADPPFNWNRAYDKWHDAMPEDDYLAFTFEWLRLCVKALRPGGALWVNIPDDWAAEIVCFLKGRLHEKPPAPLTMQNWCVWHYRFGQNTTSRFINSKVHALYFTKDGGERTWNRDKILEPSDRASTYNDPRTLTKRDGMPAGLRVPMDVWYGRHWGRIQGNNKERRPQHDNQLPEVYLSRVVLATSNEGGLVMDPFLGSGTTGVIAHALGRRFIGCEFSKENAERAFARIQEGPIRPPETPSEANPIFPRRGKPRRVVKAGE